MVIPPWAGRIKVDKQDACLLVTGVGTSFQPMPNDGNVEWDRDLLRGFDAGRRKSREEARMAPHLLFAEATTTQKQLDFTKKFGPFLATKISWGAEPDILIAHQERRILVIEQKLFSQILELIRSLRKLKEWSNFEPKAVQEYNDYPLSILRGDLSALEKDLLLRQNANFDTFLLKRGKFQRDLLEEIENVREMVITIQELIDSYPQDIVWDLEGDLVGVPKPFSWGESVSLGSFCSEERLSRDLSSNVVMLANLMLCRAFSQIPLTLHYAGGVVLELPAATPYGIRGVLYYMLRVEYLYQREIKICTRPTCGFYFVQDRSDMVYCSKSCKNRDSQRRLRERRKLETQKKPQRLVKR
jgi:hypothetical protein